MNNKFKRALSSILAFIMLASCVCVMNVSSVFANGNEWSYQDDTTTIPAVFGFTDSEGNSTLSGTYTMADGRKGFFTEAIFKKDDGTTTGEFCSRTGYNLQSTSTSNYPTGQSNKAAQYASFTPTTTGKIKFYIASNNSSAKTDAFRFYNDNDGALGTQIDENHGLPKRDDTDTGVGSVTLDVEANTTYWVYANTQVVLFRMVFTPTAYKDAEGVTVSVADNTLYVGDTIKASAVVSPSDANQAVTWSSSDSNVASVGADGTITAVSKGTADITATVKSDTTISNKVTINVEEISVVELNASEDGIKFSREGKAHLTTGKEYGGAYASADDVENGNYVQLDKDGALLYDNSSSTTTLTVPVSISENATKVTFSGTITTVANTSGSWTLFSVNGSDGAIARIRVGSDKTIGLQKDTSDEVSTKIGIANNTSYDFKLILNYSIGKASLEINKGDAVEVEFDKTQAITNITSMTAGDAFRSLRLGDITFAVEAPVAEIVTKPETSDNLALVKYNNNYYAVATIADIENVVSLSLKKVDDEIAETDTVYSSVTFDKAYTASDFNTGIASDGYVFAFAIDNDTNVTADDIKTAIAGITVTANKTEATVAE